MLRSQFMNNKTLKIVPAVRRFVENFDGGSQHEEDTEAEMGANYFCGAPEII